MKNESVTSYIYEGGDRIVKRILHIKVGLMENTHSNRDGKCLSGLLDVFTPQCYCRVSDYWHIPEATGEHPHLNVVQMYYKVFKCV